MTATRHHEHEQIPGMRLGLRPADPARPVLKLADMLSGTVPAHPLTVDHLTAVPDFDLYGNDTASDCGPAMFCNAIRLASLLLTGSEVRPTLNDAYDLYRRSGNPGFDPVTGADDNGVVLADMLDAATKGGAAGIKPVAYAQVDLTDLEQVRAAISIFGFLFLGVDLQKAQQAQTDQGLWDYVKGSRDWGGHAVLAGAYTSATAGADVRLETWGQLVGATDTWWNHRVQEAWVCILPWSLGTKQFQQGIDGPAANAAYKALTGRPGPFPVTPAPVTPAPVIPVPAAPRAVDQALAAAFDAWRKQTPGV